jgi:hypothetical protein
MACGPSSPWFPFRTFGVVGGRWIAPRLVVVPGAVAPGPFWSAGGYQLDLVMPGSSPRCARVRKQIRHSPNLRYTALGRPHREHLVYARTWYFGVRLALTTRLFLATDQFSLNGNPSRRNSERPSSSLVAVVTKVTSIPRCLSTWSGLISWNISCSVRPKV